MLQWGLVVAAYYFIERSARRAAELREAELERHRIEAQILEARLQVLQTQVEPHFLFNTLAHVQRLYQTNPTRGRSMLDSFCGYLRAALPRMRDSRSTLLCSMSPPVIRKREPSRKCTPHHRWLK